jgi:hypothetical protein
MLQNVDTPINVPTSKPKLVVPNMSSEILAVSPAVVVQRRSPRVACGGTSQRISDKLEEVFSAGLGGQLARKCTVAYACDSLPTQRMSCYDRAAISTEEAWFGREAILGGDSSQNSLTSIVVGMLDFLLLGRDDDGSLSGVYPEFAEIFREKKRLSRRGLVLG